MGRGNLLNASPHIFLLYVVFNAEKISNSVDSYIEPVTLIYLSRKESSILLFYPDTVL